MHTSLDSNDLQNAISTDRDLSNQMTSEMRSKKSLIEKINNAYDFKGDDSKREIK